MISSVATEKRMMTRVIILTHHRLQRRRRIVIVNSQTLILVTIASRMLKGPPQATKSMKTIWTISFQRKKMMMPRKMMKSLSSPSLMTTSRGKKNALFLVANYPKRNLRIK